MKTKKVRCVCDCRCCVL